MNQLKKRVRFQSKQLEAMRLENACAMEEEVNRYHWLMNGAQMKSVQVLVDKSWMNEARME